MSIIQSPEIEKAYEAVRDDKDDTNWMLLEYEGDRKDILKVAATGSGGLKEMVERFSPDQAAFAYVRVKVANDELSQRVKFVLVPWCGPQVKVMRRAKLSVHIAEVKSVIKVFAIEVPASEKEDLKEEDIILKLKRAGGANYDRQGSDY
ncbi:MAG: actin depolymerizing protein [Piptocephalis tieghemiana]|nr:MAG: actin depolymerizing protein [Piptocephalis tieghemiana]